MPRRDLTTRDVAEILDVSEEWVRREAKRGRLAGDVDERGGRHIYRFCEADVRAYERWRELRRDPHDSADELTTGDLEFALANGRIAELEHNENRLRAELEQALKDVASLEKLNARLRKALRAMLEDEP